MRRFTRAATPAASSQFAPFLSSKGGPAEKGDEELLKKKPFEGHKKPEEAEEHPTEKRHPAQSIMQFLRRFKSGASTRPDVIPIPKANNRLSTIIAREQYEESIKEELPPKPRPPRGWILDHKSGTNYFSLSKNVHIEGSNGPEKLTAFAKMETKVPDVTYQGNTGERTEQQHLVFTLFVQRVYPEDEASKRHTGGLEFTLTSVDSELVLDGLTVHSTAEHLQSAMYIGFQSRETNNIVPLPAAALAPPPAQPMEEMDAPATRKPPVASSFAFKSFSKIERRNHAPAHNKHLSYRGPYTNELDEELTDEIFDYLDDRGINNAFAEFMMSQAHFIEQEEYLNWLELLKQFSRAPAPPNHKTM